MHCSKLPCKKVDIINLLTQNSPDLTLKYQGLVMAHGVPAGEKQDLALIFGRRRGRSLSSQRVSQNQTGINSKYLSKLSTSSPKILMLCAWISNTLTLKIVTPRRWSHRDRNYGKNVKRVRPALFSLFPSDNRTVYRRPLKIDFSPSSWIGRRARGFLLSVIMVVKYMRGHQLTFRRWHLLVACSLGCLGRTTRRITRGL